MKKLIKKFIEWFNKVAPDETNSRTRYNQTKELEDKLWQN
jgi:hypothetical protein